MLLGIFFKCSIKASKQASRKDKSIETSNTSVVNGGEFSINRCHKSGPLDWWGVLHLDGGITAVVKTHNYLKQYVCILKNNW